MTGKTKHLVTFSSGEGSHKQTNQTIMSCGITCCEDKGKADGNRGCLECERLLFYILGQGSSLR